jgi:CRP-like cAMP-binding protein
MTMNAAALRKFPLFGGMEESELDALARLSADEEYPAGISVMEEGRLASALFVVERGEVEIGMQENQGAGKRVSYVEPGGVFGCSALCNC